MNNIRNMIMMVVCLAWHTATFGQTFNPSSPPEPDAPQIKHRLTLVATPSEGGTVTGGGLQLDETTVTLRATASSAYTFEAWSDKEGMVVSTSSSFQYTTKTENDTLYAHFRFTPSSPGEPAEPSTTLYYRLTLEPDQGCTVSGGGRYLAGTKVSVSASVESGYEFVNWTDASGAVVSTSRSMSYTKLADNEVLTAHCRFNPSAPTEPGEPILKHWVRATSTDGGTIGGSTNIRILEGNSFSLSATANAGYEFLGWYLDGEYYTSLRSFSYTMGKTDLNFQARFRFNPSSPTEPAMPALQTYSFYLPTVNDVPGSTIKYSINLVNTEIVRDMNIRLTFPAGVEISPENYALSDKASGYDVTITEAVDTISIIEEGARLWDFTMIGGMTQPATQALLTFDVFLPDTIDTGYSHEVKINQISMTMDDGTAVTAHTRNGRIGVYEWGDANTDGEVDVFDVSLVTSHILGDDVEIDEHISDIHNDETIDVFDVSGIISVVLDSNNK